MIGYYVTVQRKTAEGFKTAWLLGPFDNHADAKAAVTPAYEAACEIDPWMAFDAHGTSSITSEKALPPGKLNARLRHLLPSIPLAA